MSVTLPLRSPPARGLGLEEARVTAAPRSQWGLAWRQFRRHRLALAGAAVFAALCVSALAAPLSPYDPNRTSLLLRFEPPSRLFGTRCPRLQLRTRFGNVRLHLAFDFGDHGLAPRPKVAARPAPT